MGKLSFHLCWTQRNNPKSSGSSKYNPTLNQRDFYWWYKFLSHLDHIEVNLPVVASPAWYEPVPILLLLEIQMRPDLSFRNKNLLRWIDWGELPPGHPRLKKNQIIVQTKKAGWSSTKKWIRYRSEWVAVLTWWSPRCRWWSTSPIPTHIILIMVSKLRIDMNQASGLRGVPGCEETLLKLWIHFCFSPRGLKTSQIQVQVLPCNFPQILSLSNWSSSPSSTIQHVWSFTSFFLSQP